jgi:hypothetical protein
MTSTATLGHWRNGGTAATPWLAAGALVLAVGLGAFFVHPLLGAAVLGTFAVPLFVSHRSTRFSCSWRCCRSTP